MSSVWGQKSIGHFAMLTPPWLTLILIDILYSGRTNFCWAPHPRHIFINLRHVTITNEIRIKRIEFLIFFIFCSITTFKSAISIKRWLLGKHLFSRSFFLIFTKKKSQPKRVGLGGGCFIYFFHISLLLSRSTGAVVMMPNFWGEPYYHRPIKTRKIWLID